MTIIKNHNGVMVIVDAGFRLLFRLGYPLARLWWRMFGGRVHGACVALRFGDELLVLRESYRTGLGLPAGGCAAGESFVDTAIREVYEEVGISLCKEKLVHLKVDHFAFEGREITNSLFEIRLDERATPVIDNREIVWAGWMRLADIDARSVQRQLLVYLQTQAGDDSGEIKIGERLSG